MPAYSLLMESFLFRVSSDCLRAILHTQDVRVSLDTLMSDLGHG